MTFFTLTALNGVTIHVNPDHVVTLTEKKTLYSSERGEEEVTIIHFSDGSIQTLSRAEGNKLRRKVP